MTTQSTSKKHSFKFPLPVHDFKRIETPLDHKGYRDYICVADVLDLPNLADWTESNVRDAKTTGRVPNEIRSGLLEDELFVFMNRGIVLVADRVEYDNKANSVVIEFTNPNYHGLIDGGHTNKVIQEEMLEGLKEALAEEEPPTRHIKIELLVGFGLEEIVSIVKARNTSNEVREQSILELQGAFEKLRKSISGQDYAKDIAYREYELYEDDPTTAKPIPVRDIVSLMTMFDTDRFNDEKHPIKAYSGKEDCLRYFGEQVKSGKNNFFDKIYPLLPDILKLHDEIHLKLAQLYREARKKVSDDETRGDLGKLKGVAPRKTLLPFSRKHSLHRVPNGFVYPMLAAFRAVLYEKSGRLQWGADPFELLNNGAGLKMARQLAIRALEHRNPNKTGKTVDYWDACYREVETAYLKQSKK